MWNRIWMSLTHGCHAVTMSAPCRVVTCHRSRSWQLAAGQLVTSSVTLRSHTHNNTTCQRRALLWFLSLIGIWRNIVIGWIRWKLRNGEKSTNASGQKCYRGKGRHCNPSHNISAQATERDETPETSQANIKILSRTPNCCSPPPRLVFCLYARSQYSFCYLLTAAVENYIFWAQAFKEGRNQAR